MLESGCCSRALQQGTVQQLYISDVVEVDSGAWSAGLDRPLCMTHFGRASARTVIYDASTKNSSACTVMYDLDTQDASAFTVMYDLNTGCLSMYCHVRFKYTGCLSTYSLVRYKYKMPQHVQSYTN